MTDGVYAGVTSSFWEQYTKGRPAVPQSFWTRIFDYHSAHSAHFTTVFDLGAGPGNHSYQLAKRFSHVIVGDPSQTNVDKARDLLAPTSGQSNTKYEFLQCLAESSTLPDKSVDMIFMANAFHWVDPYPTLTNVARQLKPGGTFVAALFFIPYFDDPDVRKIHGRLMTRSVERAMGSYKSELGIKQTVELQDSGYDSVALPKDLFEDKILRVKLNIQGRDAPLKIARFDGRAIVSKLGSRDQVVEVEDADWAFNMTLQDVKASFASFPGFDVDTDDFAEQSWKELAAVRPDGCYKGAWPVSIVLATRSLAS